MVVRTSWDTQVEVPAVNHTKHWKRGPCTAVTDPTASCVVMQSLPIKLGQGCFSVFFFFFNVEKTPNIPWNNALNLGPDR